MIQRALCGVSMALIMSAAAAGTREDLEAADRALQEAVTARDLEAILAFYADTVVLMPTAEPQLQGKAALREEWEHILAIPGMQSTGELQHAEVSDGGDMGYTRGVYVARMQGESGDTVEEPGKYLTVWKHTADGWRVIVETYNTDIPPPDHK